MKSIGNFTEISNEALAEITGGKLVHYPYGVTYNTNTGHTSVDPSGFIGYWQNNVAHLAVSQGH